MTSKINVAIDEEFLTSLLQWHAQPRNYIETPRPNSEERSERSFWQPSPQLSHRAPSIIDITGSPNALAGDERMYYDFESTLSLLKLIEIASRQDLQHGLQATPAHSQEVDDFVYTLI